MAQTDIRPRAVVLLTDVDTSRRDEPGRLYHHDGRPFTTAEYDLLCTCTRAEIDIAVAHMQPVGAWMSERHTMQKALIGLYMKYAYQFTDASPDSVYDLVTDEDYAKFERLAEILSPGDAVEDLAGHEQD
ncbi:hypothetical protein PUR33_05155 [Streptomyces sp. BE282]|uniref:hypothetical protein n=1 Tax=unclassified Streptomyces TaxID=2593676 RepID=UPI0023B97FB7|nr:MULTISPECIES: hypothetical protein [unclassified Streptomyces]MEE1728510.1 hypothetical protein [Streptomyces sp. BE282]WEH35024.1 hypothetical protein PZB75_17655 [Streptomyces sp. AM 4-1-1]